MSVAKKTRPFQVNDHVRTLANPEDSPDGYGRINFIIENGEKRFHVVNMNMPYSGTVSAWFSASELARG